MQCTNCGAQIQPGATVCPSCEERVIPTSKAVAVPRKRKADPALAGEDAKAPVKAPKPPKAPRDPSKPPVWVRPVAAITGVVLLAVAGWFIYSLLTAGPNTPDGAALRFMQAYASYDARGMLDNSTHASFTATDQATFERDMANAPASSKAQPIYKDLKVASVTVDAKDANTAVVKLAGLMLSSGSATATATADAFYTPREETLTVVKSASGKWLVKWN